jgi:hypothetical protein
MKGEEILGRGLRPLPYQIPLPFKKLIKGRGQGIGF